MNGTTIAEDVIDSGKFREWGPVLALNTRRGRFLYETDRIFPWENWAAMIEPHYPKRGKGRPPYPLGTLLRLYMLQQWYGLSDLAAQEMATDSVAVRNFLGLPLTWDKRAPDESTIAGFRRLLARHRLAVEIVSEAVATLNEQGWKIRQGECADPSIFAAAI